MTIKKETIKGNLIINEYVSSNIMASTYDRESKNLNVTFKGGRKYVYENVPMHIFTKMRLAESQGKYFNREISRKFRYKEIK